jgi:hypothetical protein
LAIDRFLCSVADPEAIPDLLPLLPSIPDFGFHLLAAICRKYRRGLSLDELLLISEQLLSSPLFFSFLWELIDGVGSDAFCDGVDDWLRTTIIPANTTSDVSSNSLSSSFNLSIL